MHPKLASRSRRRHSAELRDKVLAACAEPGASVAAVALAHDLNANLVHKWRRCRNAGPSATPDLTAPQAVALSVPPTPRAAALPAAGVERRVAAPAQLAQQAPTASTVPDLAGTFVPVRLEMPRAAPAEIRLELRRGASTVIVTWPAEEAATCGRWLREWLG